ncbi:MAG: tRNA uridine(34) 5-carboxymethylaminomethyl modification radical SAM/GNAT enzyme Elp3 [Anaerolineae bacterium]|nr:tRNA uridine(34) 5-carboxymethylaminomethyl modification radical SAM/GNAT enzyme Elp3 [Anaerolineae bacterium]
MRHKPTLDLEQYRDPLVAILQAVIEQSAFSRQDLERLLRAHPKDGRGMFSKNELIQAYRAFAGSRGLPSFDPDIVARLRMKPIRTMSGVTPVTVLTKPFPCPGECIFCPNDVRMPKSYLANEPGAQRAEQNNFDPYLQTYSRLRTLYETGHPTNKIELIILGGTWSFYPETYQIWFVKRIFDALHDFGQGIDHTGEVRAALRDVSQFHPDHPDHVTDLTLDGTQLDRNYNQVVQAIYQQEMQRSRDQAAAITRGERARGPVDEYATWDELEAAHRQNENAACRCVGLVVETRPDHLDVAEVIRIRRLGATKVQVGIQSLDDDVLRLNKRGHIVAMTRRAINLLRAAGFKIHAHWMPNLYGSSPDADIVDYERLFADPDFRPDELKLYPCSLIESAELMQRYQDGSWRPYTHDELLHVLTECFLRTPEYCRLTRVVRDIPSHDIVDGNQMTNFRQLVDRELQARGQRSPDIRAREIRGRKVSPDDLSLDELWYESGIGQEVFLQVITPERHIAGFLRLSLPDILADTPPVINELAGAAMIREVHVYGQALDLGEESPGRAQHSGLGTQLIEHATGIAVARGYRTLAVISSVGTRDYYRKRGFTDGQLYQFRAL